MRKILVIDDDDNIRIFFKTLLNRLGFDVALAENGKAGLAEAAKPDIEMIISDLFMQGNPYGLDLIRQLRESRPDCPIIVISGKGDEATVRDCNGLGVTEFLTKPFEIGFIRDILDRQPPKRSAAQGAP